MRRETFVLAVLVTVLVIINSLFLIIIQSSAIQKGEALDMQGRVVQTLLTKNDPTKLFTPDVFSLYSARKTDATAITVKAPTISTTSSTDKKVPTQVGPAIPFVDTQGSVGNIEEVITPSGEKITINYDKNTFTYKGREIFAIEDNYISPELKYRDLENTMEKSSQELLTWVYYPYERFDVYVETNYNNSNYPEIKNFLDEFSLRYELMEQETGWTSEEYFGQKLKINISENTEDSACAKGGSLPGRSKLFFSDPFMKEGCEEWYYHAVGLHEALHGAGPIELFMRHWLSEGFSEYNMYNILAQYGDIAQATADSYIETGNIFWNWEDYKNTFPEYNDSCFDNPSIPGDPCSPHPDYAEIQDSWGYDITAWMFSMMRDNYGMSFSDFYGWLNNNMETLDYADSMWSISDYYTDMVIIDLFGRAAGLNFPQTKNIWEYNGPNGPGWGVRNWVDTSWYADLAPEITSIIPTDNFPNAGDTITINARIYNYGDVALENVEYKILINGVEKSGRASIDIGASPSYAEIGLENEQITESGPLKIEIIVDPNNLKLETDKTNNAVVQWVGLQPISDISVDEKGTVNIYPKIVDYENTGINYQITGTYSNLFTWDNTNKRFYWQTAETSSGNYLVNINATGSSGSQTQTVNVEVRNTCSTYYKDQMCWNCEADCHPEDNPIPNFS